VRRWIMSSVEISCYEPFWHSCVFGRRGTLRDERPKSRLVRMGAYALCPAVESSASSAPDSWATQEVWRVKSDPKPECHPRRLHQQPKGMLRLTGTQAAHPVSLCTTVWCASGMGVAFGTWEALHALFVYSTPGIASFVLLAGPITSPRRCAKQEATKQEATPNALAIRLQD